MRDEPDSLESVRAEYERRHRSEPYVPRPKWQIVMAWALLAVVVLGIINLCWIEMSGA